MLNQTLNKPDALAQMLGGDLRFGLSFRRTETILHDRSLTRAGLLYHFTITWLFDTQEQANIGKPVFLNVALTKNIGSHSKQSAIVIRLDQSQFVKFWFLVELS